LGETYNAEMMDGSKVFCEQTFHKPPISHIFVEGPNECYKFYGYTGFSAKAWLNSVTLFVVGTKTIEFTDGTKIVWNN